MPGARGRRGVLDRQLRQGEALRPRRRPPSPGRAGREQGARALFRLGAGRAPLSRLLGRRGRMPRVRSYPCDAIANRSHLQYIDGKKQDWKRSRVYLPLPWVHRQAGEGRHRRWAALDVADLCVPGRPAALRQVRRRSSRADGLRRSRRRGQRRHVARGAGAPDRVVPNRTEWSPSGPADSRNSAFVSVPVRPNFVEVGNASAGAPSWRWLRGEGVSR